MVMQDHRRRSKYLGHLPIGCTITLVSVDLSGIVSKETLDLFVGKMAHHLCIKGTLLTCSCMIDHTVPEKQPEKSVEDAHEELTCHETIRELVAEEEWSDEEEMLQHVLRISALEYHKESTGRDATTTTHDQAEKQVDEDNDDHIYDDWEWEEYVESKSVRQRR